MNTYTSPRWLALTVAGWLLVGHAQAQTRSPRDVHWLDAQTVLVTLGLALAAQAAEPASGSSFRSEPKDAFDGVYAKRGTWQETIRTVREAMFAREPAWNATAMEQAKPVPGVTLNPWWRLGPLPVPEGNCAVDTPFAPEQEWDLTKPVGESKWVEASDLKDGRDIRCPLPGGRIMYFCRTITAVKPTHVVVMFRWGGRDGTRGGWDPDVWQGMAAQLNGVKVLRQERGIGFTGHDLNVRLHLKKGENRLLVKVLGGRARVSAAKR